MPIPSQYSSAQLPEGTSSGTLVDFGSSLPINFCGQTVNTLPSMFTVAGWVRLLNAPSTAFALFSVSDQFQITVSTDGLISAQFTSGQGVAQSEVGLSDGIWHYVGASFTQSEDGSAAGTLSLYIDGFQADTEHVTSQASQTAGDCALGVNAPSLDCASWAMWSSPLPSDVMDVPLWGAPVSGTEADQSLVAAWDFANGPATDQSGNSNPATIAQQVWHVPCLSLGANDQAQPDPADNLNPGGGPFTVMGWAYAPNPVASTQ
ncbi:MAG: LamG-like jellyroll fold domain-containing protein [Acidobacteriota bacterium]